VKAVNSFKCLVCGHIHKGSNPPRSCPVCGSSSDDFENYEEHKKPLRILVTGMSGTGKSTVLQRLGERGYHVIDTDSHEWSGFVTLPDGSSDWVWREDEIMELLSNSKNEVLFVSGCKSNQGKFYSYFEHIVLLSAPAEVILSRIESRTNNNYGKSSEEREEVLKYLAEVEPRLRRTATVEINAALPLDEVVMQLESLAKPYYSL
jgi:shikimate kinase/rubredoxin